MLAKTTVPLQRGEGAGGEEGAGAARLGEWEDLWRGTFLEPKGSMAGGREQDQRSREAGWARSHRALQAMHRVRDPFPSALESHCRTL